ncbi:MAG: hypothetical protein V1872_06225 [bacterium]
MQKKRGKEFLSFISGSILVVSIFLTSSMAANTDSITIKLQPQGPVKEGGVYEVMQTDPIDENAVGLEGTLVLNEGWKLSVSCTPIILERGGNQDGNEHLIDLALDERNFTEFNLRNEPQITSWSFPIIATPENYDETDMYKIKTDLFLVHDINYNGLVDDGSELFGTQSTGANNNSDDPSDSESRNPSQYGFYYLENFNTAPKEQIDNMIDIRDTFIDERDEYIVERRSLDVLKLWDGRQRQKLIDLLPGKSVILEGQFKGKMKEEALGNDEKISNIVVLYLGEVSTTPGKELNGLPEGEKIGGSSAKFVSNYIEEIVTAKANERPKVKATKIIYSSGNVKLEIEEMGESFLDEDVSITTDKIRYEGYKDYKGVEKRPTEFKTTQVKHKPDQKREVDITDDVTIEEGIIRFDSTRVAGVELDLSEVSDFNINEVDEKEIIISVGSKEKSSITELTYEYIMRNYYDVWLAKAEDAGKISGDPSQVPHEVDPANTKVLANTKLSLGFITLEKGLQPPPISIRVDDLATRVTLAHLQELGETLIAKDTRGNIVKLQVLEVPIPEEIRDGDMVRQKLNIKNYNAFSEIAIIMDKTGEKAKINADGTMTVVTVIGGSAGGGMIDLKLTPAELETFKKLNQSGDAILCILAFNEVARELSSVASSTSLSTALSSSEFTPTIAGLISVSNKSNTNLFDFSKFSNLPGFSSQSSSCSFVTKIPIETPPPPPPSLNPPSGATYFPEPTKPIGFNDDGYYKEAGVKNLNQYLHYWEDDPDFMLPGDIEGRCGDFGGLYDNKEDPSWCNEFRKDCKCKEALETTRKLIKLYIQGLNNKKTLDRDNKDIKEFYESQKGSGINCAASCHKPSDL